MTSYYKYKNIVLAMFMITLVSCNDKEVTTETEVVKKAESKVQEVKNIESLDNETLLRKIETINKEFDELEACDIEKRISTVCYENSLVKISNVNKIKVIEDELKSRGEVVPSDYQVAYNLENEEEIVKKYEDIRSGNSKKSDLMFLAQLAHFECEFETLSCELEEKAFYGHTYAVYYIQDQLNILKNLINDGFSPLYLNMDGNRYSRTEIFELINNFQSQINQIFRKELEDIRIEMIDALGQEEVNEYDDKNNLKISMVTKSHDIISQAANRAFMISTFEKIINEDLIKEKNVDYSKVKSILIELNGNDKEHIDPSDVEDSEISIELLGNNFLKIEVIR